MQRVFLSIRHLFRGFLFSLDSENIFTPYSGCNNQKIKFQAKFKFHVGILFPSSVRKWKFVSRKFVKRHT